MLLEDAEEDVVDWKRAWREARVARAARGTLDRMRGRAGSIVSVLVVRGEGE